MGKSRKRKKRKKYIIFDLDGTLTNFREIDDKIIYKIFDDRIKWLNDFLWFVNSKDILKNTMFILKFRILLYCIIDYKPIYKSYQMYRQEYFFETSKALKEKREVLLKLNEEYKVVVLSNNKFSKGISIDKIPVINRSSKYKYLKCLQTKHEVEYFVGNNLFDDVLVCLGSSTKSVYVGSNKLIKKIANFGISVDDFLLSMLKLI